MKLTIYAFFVMITMSGIARADNLSVKSHPLLQALGKCPENEPACVVFDANLFWPGKTSGNPSGYPGVIDVDLDEKTGYGTAIIVVQGRLNDGPVMEYRLGFHYPADQLDCKDTTIAMAGVSTKTKGTIYTDNGRLQIVSNNLSFGSRSSVSVIHMESLIRKNHLSPGWEKSTWDGEPIFKADGRMLWRVRGRCLDLESEEMFRLLPEQQCRGADLLHAEQTDIDKIQDARVFKNSYANERLKFDLWRLEGSPYVVYIWGVACT